MGSSPQTSRNLVQAKWNSSGDVLPPGAALQRIAAPQEVAGHVVAYVVTGGPLVATGNVFYAAGVAMACSRRALSVSLSFRMRRRLRSNYPAW
jgi:hypothetical protein